MILDYDYRRVCDAFAEVVFGPEQAGRPVYTLADPDTLRQVLESAGIEDATLDGFSNLVRSTLQISKNGIAPFRWQAQAALRHRAQPLETPPALPLLVLLSIAAEQMHKEGDVAAHNYYSRFHKLLKVSANDQQRVENDYRRNADLLWGSLNIWLEAWEGKRGMPTAYAVGGHAFVGLPMSQALVRQHDRASFHELFAIEGMTPGLHISPDEMKLAIDPYATAVPSLPLSSHLARLWREPAAKERIVDAACLELEAWDGSGIEAVASEKFVVATRLLAFLRTFPRQSIEFNLMLPYRSEGPSFARFRLADGESTVPTVAGPGGSSRLSGVEGVSAVSLVEEETAGEFGNDKSRVFGRRPKRVVALRWDDLQGAYVEVERIALGEDSIVVARSDARQRVQAHLMKHARPGWRELVDLPGAPENWHVFKHVQIVSVPTERLHFELQPLAPRTRTSLTLRGGFVLPGLLRKWSVIQPPEAVAVAAGAESIIIRIYRGARINPDEIVAESTQYGELAVLSIANRELPDGEYIVAMFVDGASRPSSTAVLRLRSARTPQLELEDGDKRLVYSPESSSRWPLTADFVKSHLYVNGPRFVGPVSPAEEPDSKIPEFAPRAKRKSVQTTEKIHVGTPVGSDSCLNTGKHRFILPTVRQGQVPKRSIEGECATCGLVRRFAGTVWAAKRKRNGAETIIIPDIPPVVESDEANFEVAFDALNHIGAGSIRAFDRIASQIEGSGLFADTFLRQLEVVGHVDVRRDGSLRAAEWAVNSSTLVPVGDRRWVLIGARSGELLEKLENLVRGRAVLNRTVDAELVRVEIIGDPSATALKEIGVALLGASPSRSIAEALPPLSEVARSLKRVAVPFYRYLEFWDTSSASWLPVEALSQVGAYRLKNFESTYAIRSAEDIANGVIGLGNAQIVKHIANLWAGDPLIGYHSRSGSVVTLLGSDLPALYGRPLALCSGRVPRQITNFRMLQYPGVPREVADVIFDRVSR